jgi:uncharacterized protein (DUF2267 family)
VDYERFIEIVQQKAHVDREAAEWAVRATLETLAERISPGERQDLAAQLPPELRPALLSVEGPRQVFHVKEFLRRASQKERIKEPVAEEHARAVFAALGLAVPADAWAGLTAELEADLGPLLAEAQRERGEAARRKVPALSAEDFVARVARRTGLDEDGARAATEAVLETLAERISGREVDALTGWLPAELHPPLKRGRERSRGEPRAMPLEEFERLVAVREGTSRALARLHTRAVFTTLREALDEREYSHVAAQLPDDYVVLLPTP